MKKILVLAIALSLSLSAQAQFTESDWQLSFGLNAISDSQSGNPVDTEDLYFNSLPLAVGLQYNVSDILAVEQMVTFNQLPDGIEDSGPLDKKYYYFSADTSLKYNFGQLFLPRRNRIDLYINGGLGIYQVEKSSVTANFGGGVLWWVTDAKNFGLRLQTLGKFGKQGDNEFIRNNHFQHTLQAVIVLN